MWGLDDYALLKFIGLSICQIVLYSVLGTFKLNSSGSHLFNFIFTLKNTLPKGGLSQMTLQPLCHLRCLRCFNSPVENFYGAFLLFIKSPYSVRWVWWPINHGGERLEH